MPDSGFLLPFISLFYKRVYIKGVFLLFIKVFFLRVVGLFGCKFSKFCLLVGVVACFCQLQWGAKGVFGRFVMLE